MSVKTTQGVIKGIRARLGYPPLNILINDTVYEVVQDEAEHMNSQLKLTTQKWLATSMLITVNPAASFDTSAILLPNQDFGRGDFLETVPTSGLEGVREVDLVDLQDLSHQWSGYAPIGGDLSHPHNATHAAVYRDSTDGQWYIKFVPPAHTSSQYRLWYMPGVTANSALSARPGFPMQNFYNLLKINCAITLLGLLRDKNYLSTEQFADKLTALTDARGRYQEIFDRYILQDSEEQAGPITGFNDSRRWGGGGGGF